MYDVNEHRISYLPGWSKISKLIYVRCTCVYCHSEIDSCITQLISFENITRQLGRPRSPANRFRN